jgi:hypothetical protein
MDFPAWRGVERKLSLDAIRLQPEFAAFKGIEGELDEAALARPALLGFHLRLALEAAYLRGKNVAAGLAALAAARAAALYIQGDFELLAAADLAALPCWVNAMASEIAPPAGALQGVSAQADAAEIERVRQVWSLLGTVEALMETGGDIRLQRDPVSGLNGYGSSHRPRPWAVTFASSTASSCSERGYAAADRVRLRTTAALLRGAVRPAVGKALRDVRDGIARVYGLPAGAAVVLAASGTDTELLALALTHLSPPDAPVLNILIAPEETGRGVPMAARGLHFAVDTALGAAVTFEAPIAGYRADTGLTNIFLRDVVGTLRAAALVEAEIAAAVAHGIACGQKVILHALDLSKTGLLAPGLEFLRQLRNVHGEQFDIVVDACQARLSPGSVRAYLDLHAAVLITGSKFFTGPPFAGAVLLPPGIAARLAAGALPEGLDAYFGRDEFPYPCPAAAALPPVGNYGLALRWHAALAEMRALLRVRPARRAEILQGFAAVVAQEIAANPALSLLPQPEIYRGAHEEAWERCASIFTFSLRAPHDPGRFLNPAEARSVYLWLNADLAKFLPFEAALAARICHIGQPVKLPQPGVEGAQGVLRVSAGARLISGEPSHQGLGHKTRIRREFTDLAVVFHKIDLILRHWAVLAAASPAPCYRPARSVVSGQPSVVSGQ